ncbi:hypothetical protein GLYMA_15G000200v4 [Glycine max]|uniref:Uncharacterized protein n=2 Tax=Glycine subgen. Soja TaxID=1462606 RepID=K7M8M9_SOYBN|nr:uncharacterized protein LOC114388423 isoform X2 [Glycine soja]XP_028204713.1 uncharacterized protein LOC114388423 isoform X2 [Glycine soja]KHN22375.1 hypothetical protein glysoja_024884 [Glycine soja]KRH09583.1 hypothetical protein GLYMA_15G000200v4 [Glycine max]
MRRHLFNEKKGKSTVEEAIMAKGKQHSLAIGFTKMSTKDINMEDIARDAGSVDIEDVLYIIPLKELQMELQQLCSINACNLPTTI